MTGTHVQALFEALAEYLRDFHAGLSRSEEAGVPHLGRGSFWSRGDGTLHLSTDEYRDYRRLLENARLTLAPDGDLSESAIDSALQTAIFGVVDLAGTRSANAEIRIEQAIDGFRSFVETPAQEYECWVEIEGLRTDALPAVFGATRFVLLGAHDIEHLADLIRSKHTADQEGKLSTLHEWMAEDIRGRPVAVLRIDARDGKAALSLAMRELGVTLECLNFFADIIPYNRHRRRLDGTRTPTCLRIGEANLAIALRMTVANDGSFTHSPEATKVGSFSIERLRDLQPPAADAVKRVEALMVKKARSPVDELLLRAVRWVGRAADASTAEDQLLFSMIALECLALPTGASRPRQKLSARIADMLVGDDGDRGVLQEEVGRLYGIRSELVHEGSREIPGSASEWLFEVALEATMRALVSGEAEQAQTLRDLDGLWRTGRSF